MPHHEPRDRRVIRHNVAGNHPVRDILAAVTLNRARGAHLRRVRVQHQPHHHRRLIRRPATTISPIRPIERREVHLSDRVDHEPRQVIGRQPIPYVRRQKKALFTPTVNEVLRHAEILLNMPDGTSFVRQPPRHWRSGLRPRTHCRCERPAAAWPRAPGRRIRPALQESTHESGSDVSGTAGGDRRCARKQRPGVSAAGRSMHKLLGRRSWTDRPRR